jgi:hypothetical protein
LRVVLRRRNAFMEKVASEYERGQAEAAREAADREARRDESTTRRATRTRTTGRQELALGEERRRCSATARPTPRVSETCG